MPEKRPLDSPEGNWWDEDVNRREAMWLGLSGTWAAVIFGWMVGWTRFGEQNQIGPTEEVSPEAFQKEVTAFKERADRTKVDDQVVLVPPKDDVYVGAFQWGWDGLPAVLKAGETYTFHLGSYDVQHGFSVRDASNLSQQMSLQVLPGYEWKVDMSFEDPGTYHVVCNEFCGTGHRTMHSKFFVREEIPKVQVERGADGPYGGWFSSGAKGGETTAFTGSPADRTGQDEVTVAVGAEGNGGPYAFDPSAVVVSEGTTVTFDWLSDGHNVVVESQPDGASWQGHESIENEGFSFGHTFDTKGVYKYYCTPHVALGMKGVVEVK